MTEGKDLWPERNEVYLWVYGKATGTHLLHPYYSLPTCHSNVLNSLFTHRALSQEHSCSHHWNCCSHFKGFAFGYRSLFLVNTGIWGIKIIVIICLKAKVLCLCLGK